MIEFSLTIHLAFLHVQKVEAARLLALTSVLGSVKCLSCAKHPKSAAEYESVRSHPDRTGAQLLVFCVLPCATGGTSCLFPAPCLRRVCSVSRTA